MPITGQPILAARSMILHIFSAMTSPSEPPKTVKSWREDAHAAAVDRAVAGDHGVAPRPVLLHVELERAVAHERVELLEGAGVEQLLDPLAGGVLAAVVLLGLRLGRGVDRRLAQLLELGELLLVGLGGLCWRMAAPESSSVAPRGRQDRENGRWWAAPRWSSTSASTLAARSASSAGSSAAGGSGVGGRSGTRHATTACTSRSS